MRDLSGFACRSIEPRDVSLALDRGHRDERLAIRSPDHILWTACARRSWVASNAATYVVVETCGEVFGLGSGREIHYPKVGLSVGLNGLVGGAAEGEALSVGT